MISKVTILDAAMHKLKFRFTVFSLLISVCVLVSGYLVGRSVCAGSNYYACFVWVLSAISW